MCQPFGRQTPPRSRFSLTLLGGKKTLGKLLRTPKRIFYLNRTKQPQNTQLLKQSSLRLKQQSSKTKKPSGLLCPNTKPSNESCKDIKRQSAANRETK